MKIYKYITKRIIGILYLALLIFICSYPRAYADVGIAIRPTIIDKYAITFPYHTEVFISNLSDQAMVLAPHIVHIEQTPNSIHPILGGTEDTLLTSHITLLDNGTSISSLHLQPHEVKKLTLSVTGTMDNKDYIFSVIFISNSIKSDSQALKGVSAFINQQVGVSTVFLLTSQLPSTSLLGIKTATSTLIFDSKIPAKEEITSTSPTFTHYISSYTLKSLLGEKLYSSPQQSVYILAHKTRVLEQEIQPTLPFGIYSIQLQLYNPDTKILQEDSKIVVLLPPLLLFLITITILLCIYTILRTKTKLQRSQQEP